MDNENNKRPDGELSGFDSAHKVDSGYTVTPDGGFYVKQKDEIIQDEVSAPEATPEQPKSEEKPAYSSNPKNDYNFVGVRQKSYKKVKNRNKKRRYGAGVIIVASVLAAVIGAISGIAIMAPILTKEDNYVATEDKQENISINVDKTAETVVEAVAQKVTPSVVGIRTTTAVTSFFGGTQEASGDGSGVVYSSDGYIITNYHVIADAIGNADSTIAVYFDSADSKGYVAKVVGYNISADLAVIKIEAKGLRTVEFADSSMLKVGQYVVTIGNPGGLEFMDSVTYGVISGLNRVVSSDSGVELIQTDAAINPGNSGGALVDTKGKLVGINSSKIVSEEFEGMGFAIPSNTVKEICKEIIERENSPEPYFGITISERYTAKLLDYYGFPAGAVVLSVADGSPAAKAGIAKGDIITKYDSKNITEFTVLEDLIMSSKPGDKVKLTIYRSGRYYTTDVTVGSNNSVD